MRDSVEERRRRIVDVIGAHGEVRVADLATLLDVSPVTVRRDLDALGRQGAVERRHGLVSRTGGRAAQRRRADQGTVAVVVPERHAYLNEVAQAARRFLEHAGCGVELHLMPHSADPDPALLERIADDGIDGLLMAPRWQSRADEEASGDLLARLRLPTVLVERHPPAGPGMQHLDAVRSDHDHGVRLALDHLTAAGHRRILLAARRDSPTARRVTASFAQAAAEDPQVEHWHSVLSSPDASPEGETSGDDPCDAAAPSDAAGGAPQVDLSNPDWLPDLLRAEGFTAVLIHSDENALVLTQRLAFAGIRVPQDCAVIAYDDVVAGLGAVPLTAVAPPKADVGRAAAELLLQRLRTARDGEPWTPRRIELLPSLAIRAST